MSGLKQTDSEFLSWLADRLVHQYGEPENVDFVLATRRISDALAAVEQDAKRYQFLRERLIGVDFAWGEPPSTALVFEMPPGARFFAGCDANVDAAMADEKEPQ